MIDYPNIDPVVIRIYKDVAIRWYSLAYVVGYFFVTWFLKREFFKTLSCPNDDKKSIIKSLDSMIEYSILFLIFFARLFYVLFYDLVYYIKVPSEIIKVWHGGLSFHGGLLGVLLCVFIFSKRSKINPFVVLDIVSVSIPAGIFLGRVANFINAELYGRVSNCTICMVFPTDPLQVARHPSQLYEAFFEGLVLFGIMMLVYKFVYLPKKLFKNMQGCLAFGMISLYSIFRFFIEYFREPTSNNIDIMGLEITRGQGFCVIMLLVSVVYFFLKVMSLRAREARP